MYEELVKKLRYCGNAVSCLHCPYWEGCAGSKEDLTEAADAIEELKKADHRWIPVTERLPREEETVLTWGNQETILLDWRHDNKWCCFGEVTHWMPLPEPPKEET